MEHPQTLAARAPLPLKPVMWFMERCGMAGSTRRIATKIWNGALPNRPPAELVRELYAAEDANKSEPSGSRDMIGLIYPGVSRLDYDAAVEGGLARYPGAMYSQHKSNHVQVAYAPDAQAANHALAGKAAMFRGLGVEVNIRGTGHGL